MSRFNLLFSSGLFVCFLFSCNKEDKAAELKAEQKIEIEIKEKKPVKEEKKPVEAKIEKKPEIGDEDYSLAVQKRSKKILNEKRTSDEEKEA